MTKTIFAMTLVGLLSCVQTASAQSVRTYVGGGLIVAPWGGAHSQLHGSPSQTYNNTGPEAVNVGLLAEGGWFVNRTLSVGGELGLPFQRNPVTLYHGYYSPYEIVGDYRERTIFFVARAQTSRDRPVSAALTGGAGIVAGTIQGRIATHDFYPGTPPGPFGDEQVETQLKFGVTFGGGVAANIAPRFQVVPEFRLFIIKRGRAPGDPAPHAPAFPDFAAFGFDRVLYRAGVSLRASF